MSINMKLNRRKAVSLLVGFALLAAGCDKVTVEPQPGGENGKGNGEEEQLEENPKIKAALESLAGDGSVSSANLNAVAVWQDGYGPSGVWLKGTDRKTGHQMWSVTKTFTSVAVGIAVEEGSFSLSDKVAPLFPDEVENAKKSIQASTELTDEEKAAQTANIDALTVRHLPTMTDGHRTDPTQKYASEYFLKSPLTAIGYLSNDGVDVTGLLKKFDTTLPTLFFDHPFRAEPGEHFCYDSFATCILSDIFQKKTGRKVADFLYDRIFKPLGLERPVWDEIDGVTAGGWGLHLTTDGMLAFGELLLSGGRYGDKQLIPKGYLEEALSVQTEYVNHKGKDYETSGYGYQVWTCGYGRMCMAMGLFGQYIILLPDRKAVVAVTSAMPFDADHLLSDLPKVVELFSGGDDGSEKSLELVWKYVVPAL